MAAYLRLATTQDENQVLKLYDQARQSLKRAGINQWQTGRPNQQSFQNDLAKGALYIIELENQVIGACTILFEEEPTYKIIEGQWNNPAPYGVIHRICVSNAHRCEGIATQFIKYALDQCWKRSYKSLRIDTHQDNINMQKFILKMGFVYSGVIYLENKDARLAYEKGVV